MTTSKHSARILVADDDPVFRGTLSKFLVSEGYECMGTGDGPETLEELKRHSCDLLVADIDMPGNAHLELVHQVQVVAAGLPVIILTGNPTVQTAASSVRLPVTAYLCKPPNLDELRHTIREAIGDHRIYLAARRHWRRLQRLSQEAEELLRRNDSSPGDRDPRDTPRVLLAALAQLSDPALDEDALATNELAKHDRVVSAVRLTVDVLEHTKHAFKSKQLGSLRRQLVQVLEDVAPPVRSSPQG